jgi:hypothetical protein
VTKIIAASALAFCGLMTIGVGISHADEIVIPGDYQTEAGCMEDGSHIEAIDQPPAGEVWISFKCVYENRGSGDSWYMHVFSGTP